MKNRLLLLLLTVLTFRLCAQVQSDVQTQINQMMPQPIPKSPNVEALGKFGDYKVGYFSGLPDISIPLFEVKSGGLSVPIVLSYHASGVKPTDVASWVGMNWALSTGGQITRNILGKPDEQSYINQSIPANLSVCNQPGPATFYFLKYIATGVKDQQPDVFTYSFPGKSGKFLLGQAGKPVFQVPKTAMVVNPFISNSTITKFEITDALGILYRYGTSSAGITAIESTVATNGGNPTINAPTTWHLLETIAPNSNDQISFAYQPVGTSTTSDISYTYMIMDQCNFQPVPNDTRSCPFPYAPPMPVLNQQSSITQIGIKTITYKTGKVEFVLGSPRLDCSSSDPLKSLSRIDIYSLVNGSYVLQKSVSFIYSYFTNANSGTEGLQLTTVQFFDNTGAMVEQYKLSYFTNSFSWNRTNSNFLNARDLWGYYNGATTNTDLLLPDTITFQQNLFSTASTVTFGGAKNRSVNTQYIKEGVLQKIIFPTGGYTQFDYEANQYLNGSTPTLAGGLRIRKITSSDGSSAPPIVKTYKYGTGENGYGVPAFSMSQFNYYSTQQYRSAPCTLDQGILNYQIRTFFSNSALIQDSFDSSPMYYPYVTEYIGDSISTSGKTLYVFDNGTPPTDGYQVAPYSNKFYRDSFSWQRGQLTSKIVYDNSGNMLTKTVIVNTPLQLTDTTRVGVTAYQYVAGGTIGCGANNPCINEIGEQVDGQSFTFSLIRQSTGAILPTQVNEYSYQNGNVNNYVMSQTSKSYDASKFQLIQTTVNRGNADEQTVTVNRYPFQLTANVYSTGAAQAIYMLNTKNIVSAPIETYTYLQNTDGTNQRVVSSQVTSYRQNSTNTNYVVPDQIYLWESAAPVAKSSYVPVSVKVTNDGLSMDTNQRPRINIVNYDDKGNVEEVSKTNDVLISYKYGYNNALPIAEVKNAQNGQYQYTSNSQTIGNVPITMGASGTTVTQPYTFTVDYTGTVTLKLGVSGSPSYATNASYNGITSGSINPLATGGCGLSVVNFTNVAPGIYMINITLTTTNNGVGACGEIDYPKYQPVINTAGTIEFLYESFEENSSGTTNAALAHSGSRYYSGDYLVSFTMPNSRSYLIEYWYLDASNVWQYITKPYTGTSMTLAEGSAIDDVRIYPTDAQMKSYTYDPVLGIRSIIDEGCRISSYEYDSFGRLARIRNDKGEVEKQYLYNYKGN